MVLVLMCFDGVLDGRGRDGSEEEKEKEKQKQKYD